MPINNDPNAPMSGAAPTPISNWDVLKDQFKAHYEASEPQKYHLALRGIEMIQTGIAELAKLGHIWVAAETWNNKVETDRLTAASNAKAEAQVKADLQAKADTDAKTKAALAKAKSDADEKAASDAKAKGGAS